MNINTTLFNQISDHFHDYDCSQDEVEIFLKTREPFLERQQKAVQIIKGVMTTHGKQELFHHAAELARVEHGIRELEPRIRDHVVHAVLSFLLGIYISEKWLGLLVGIRLEKLQWKLAGLFHDIGYPVQISQNIFVQFTNTVNNIKRELGVDRPDVYFQITPVGLDSLTNDINSLDVIQQRVNKWGLNIDVNREYKNMAQSGEICHGIISSMATLYIIDIMYQKYNPNRIFRDTYTDNINWNQLYFENDIVPACSAIFIHNLPARCFANNKIDPKKAPLAFLLKLSDSLQQWERPSYHNQTGYSAEDFNIMVEGKDLLLQANIPEKASIQEDIGAFLVSANIKIL